MTHGSRLTPLLRGEGAGTQKRCPGWFRRVDRPVKVLPVDWLSTGVRQITGSSIGCALNFAVKWT
jgi:hypothetical protein